MGHACRGFLSSQPIFSFLRSFILDLGSGMGQTDRRTDRQTMVINALRPTLWKRGHNNGRTRLSSAAGAASLIADCAVGLHLSNHDKHPKTV